MQQILYASFQDPSLAEKTVGALMDHGVKADDITLVSSERWVRSRSGELESKTKDPVATAKGGISTTTGADAARGAAKGAGIGLGLGVLAGLASLLIPGFGIVIGGGALATAAAAAVATAAAGAVAGGVTGLLVDQGVPEPVATKYNEEIVHGGALIAILLPSGEIGQAEVRQIINKYGASSINVYAARM